MFKRLKLLLAKQYLINDALAKENKSNGSQGTTEDFCLCCSSGINCGGVDNNLEQHSQAKDIQSEGKLLN